MELSPEDIDLIDRFLKNELKGEELRAFSERMNRDEDFAAEVTRHARSLQAIDAIGRSELLVQLESISNEIRESGRADKYRPGKRKVSGKKGGSAGGFLATLTFIGIVGITAWIYFSDPHAFEPFLPEQQKIKLTDTVYHYKVKRDTIYMEKKQRIKKIMRTDTVFYDRNGNILNNRESGSIGIDTIRVEQNQQ